MKLLINAMRFDLLDFSKPAFDLIIHLTQTCQRFPQKPVKLVTAATEGNQAVSA